jgi:hypothetical protein
MRKTLEKTTATRTRRKSDPKPKAVARTRRKATPQETAANAVSASLAQVSRVVLVVFNGNTQPYAYHTRDPELKVGDFALVVSPHDGPRGFRVPELDGSLQIVRVVDVKETAHSINAASKWIVGKIDLTAAFEEAERRGQIAVLEAKIKQARKAAEERVKLEQLRELSPELDGLITQLDQLKGR